MARLPSWGQEARGCPREGSRWRGQTFPLPLLPHDNLWTARWSSSSLLFHRPSAINYPPPGVMYSEVGPSVDTVAPDFMYVWLILFTGRLRKEKAHREGREHSCEGRKQQLHGQKQIKRIGACADSTLAFWGLFVSSINTSIYTLLTFSVPIFADFQKIK